MRGGQYSCGKLKRANTRKGGGMIAVFVSYSHKQGPWVKDRLVPVLRAGGAEVLVDVERFRAGAAVVGQMDRVQDRANVHLLCLSAEYLASDYCVHEMQRAIACDPGFTRGLDGRVKRGLVVPIRLDDAPLPPAIAGPEPVWVDMRDDSKPEPWQRVLERCRAELGTTAVKWLDARDQIVRCLQRGQSANLLVPNKAAKWRELVRHVKDDHLPELGCVNLEHPATVPRDGLLNHMLQALGASARVGPPPYDLGDFERVISARPNAACLCLDHFDLAPHRSTYDVNLYSGLRYLISETRQLVLAIQSRTPFEALLPRDNPLSRIDLKTVTLG